MTTDDVLSAWTTELAEALGFPAGFDLDIDVVLDLARDAAHGVARPAAPLTTFLVGYAAGLRGGSPTHITEAAALATQLAKAREDRAGREDRAAQEAQEDPATRDQASGSDAR
jgi:hypothetical protein